MLAKVHSCSVSGIDGFIVDVEVDISYGLPVFNIVGLPEAAVKESKDRVKAAINNSGYTFPMERIVVNMAPADVRKEGTGFDLPVAAGILMAAGFIPEDLAGDYLVTGELSLDGRLKPVKAALPYALAARENGYKGIILPFENANEAAMVREIDVLPARHLSEVVDFFSGTGSIRPHAMDPESLVRPEGRKPDFSDVSGQFQAKRALEIAAAGFHNVLMTGPPGSGKSMLAKRLSTIMPDLTFEEAVDVTRIYSVLGMTGNVTPCPGQRPFRAPHHTISDAGLVGGGSSPLPGEISLAHHGVLFLDELPEFKKNVLEVLRQPLEDGKVTIARAGTHATYPSRFMLVAAMNPCPCGYLSDPNGTCTCTLTQIQKYRSKLSGPLLDRIDIQIEVPKVSYKDLSGNTRGDGSDEIRMRVRKARKAQERRLKASGIFCNARIDSRDLKTICRMDTACDDLLKKAVDVIGFSVRACHSVIRVARTIADLDGSEKIERHHLAEAVQFRSFDREYQM